MFATHARSAVLVLALLVPTACDDPPVGPPGPPALLEIESARDTIATGTSAVLDVIIRDEGGRIIADAPVTWSSRHDDVAIVDEDGTVHGVRPGVARIHASTGTVQDSTWILVASYCDGIAALPLDPHGFRYTQFLPGYTLYVNGPNPLTEYFGDPMFWGSGLIYGVHADSTLVGYGYWGAPTDFAYGLCRLDELAPFHTSALLQPNGVGSEQNPVRDVGVVHEVMAFAEEAHNDYVLHRVTFTNMRAAPVTIRAGMTVDYDLYGSPDDVGGLDSALDAAWVAAVDSLENPLTAGLLVVGHPITSYRIGPVNEGQPSRSRYYQWLGEAMIEQTSTAVDVRQVIGVQPFALAPGQQIQLWYALVAGPNRAGFEENVNAAHARILELSDS